METRRRLLARSATLPTGALATGGGLAGHGLGRLLAQDSTLVVAATLAAVDRTEQPTRASLWLRSTR